MLNCKNISEAIAFIWHVDFICIENQSLIIIYFDSTVYSSSDGSRRDFHGKQ